MPPYKQLENEYAKFVGSKYAVSCNSGTSALHLALLSLGIGKGDEVIVADFTMAACGFAISYTGATIRTVDVDDRLCIDSKKITAAITSRTKAIMAVHIYGRLCDMEELCKISKAHGIFLIEDACEAQGAVYKSKADITCYSFYKNKIISAEEGGILTTNNKKYAEGANYFKNMAFDKDHKYYHKHVGYNYRMSDAMAIQALQSLHKFSSNTKKRRQIERWYNELIPEKYQMPKRDAVWVYDTKIPFKKGVEGARHFFKPLSSMPMWKQKVGKNAQYYSQFMYLPVHPRMTKEDVRNIVKQCKI